MNILKRLVPLSIFGLLVLSILSISVVADGVSDRALSSHANSQTLDLLAPNTTFGVGGGEITTEDNALVAVGGPNGIASDQIYVPTSDQISLYVVKEGDTLGHIAELFDISPNTIRWANDISAKGTIQPGQVLTILPISSIKHTVEAGDTLASISKKYEGDLQDTAIFNGLEVDAKLAVGDVILVPGGSLGHDRVSEETKPSRPQEKPTQPAVTETKPATTNGAYFQREWGGIVTQGFHGAYRAIDYGMSIGTPIGAAAGGTVIASKSPASWNGGYGGYVAIKHDNGAQTLYAHLSKLEVSVGQRVSQGDLIGLSGNTGRSTGPHLHFEIRGWGDVPSHMR